MTLTAGTLIGFQAFFGGVQDDKTFQPALKKFHDEYYKPGAKDDDKISAVHALAQYRHEKIVKVLAPLLTGSSLPVRMITARALAQFSGVDKASQELVAGLQSQANGGRKQAAVRVEILRALGSLRCKSAAPEIARWVEDKEVWVAKAAIDASGRIRFQEAVLPLMKALRRVEGKEGDNEAGFNPLDEVFPEGLNPGALLKADPRRPKRPSERDLLRAPILGALQSITRQSFTSPKDWETWWSKNKATFKVAE